MAVCFLLLTSRNRHHYSAVCGGARSGRTVRHGPSSYAELRCRRAQLRALGSTSGTLIIYRSSMLIYLPLLLCGRKNLALVIVWFALDNPNRLHSTKANSGSTTIASHRNNNIKQPNRKSKSICCCCPYERSRFHESYNQQGS